MDWVEASLFETPGHPILIAKRDCKSGSPRVRVLCYGHYDVQPVDPVGSGKLPLEPVVCGGKVWGRGTADNKGPTSCNWRLGISWKKIRRPY
ncbi:MAG: M20/M25/M40 family metallo-hydrolase [Bacilli bacterium]